MKIPARFARLLGMTVALTLCLAVLAATAIALSYPSHSVRLVLPFSPGSATDLAARLVGQHLGTALGQPFVVGNKPGFAARSVQEFVAYVKQRPGKVTAGYGSSSSQVSIAMFNKLASVDTLAVPYMSRGSSPARRKDDLPAPEAPRMTKSCSTSRSRTSRIWSMARTMAASRPKKTAASTSSSARSPG